MDDDIHLKMLKQIQNGTYPATHSEVNNLNISLKSLPKTRYQFTFQNQHILRHYLKLFYFLPQNI